MDSLFSAYSVIIFDRIEFKIFLRTIDTNPEPLQLTFSAYSPQLSGYVIQLSGKTRLKKKKIYAAL